MKHSVVDIITCNTNTPVETDGLGIEEDLLWALDEKITKHN